MRVGVIALLSAIFLLGCTHSNIIKNRRGLEQIQAGDDLKAVTQLMGPPDLRHDINDQRFVAYYQTKSSVSADVTLTEALCTPVAFDRGKVAMVGEDPTVQWTLEEEERKRQAEIAERRRQAAEREKTARRQAEAQRQRKINALEKEVKPVPSSNAALNLALYRQLLDLDPANPHYQKKVAFYKKKYADQQKAVKQRKQQAVEEKERQTWIQEREVRNQALRQYAGNQTAQVAVHDMGNGSLYVWVKNISDRIITTHPDHFTLVNNKDSTLGADISSSLDRVLEPGSISHGRITYNDRAILKELIFENPECGRIVRSFQ
jgi:hypothetical protein